MILHTSTTQVLINRIQTRYHKFELQTCPPFNLQTISNISIQIAEHQLKLQKVTERSSSYMDLSAIVVRIISPSYVSDSSDHHKKAPSSVFHLLQAPKMYALFVSTDVDIQELPRIPPKKVASSLRAPQLTEPSSSGNKVWLLHRSWTISSRNVIYRRKEVFPLSGGLWEIFFY